MTKEDRFMSLDIYNDAAGTEHDDLEEFITCKQPYRSFATLFSNNFFSFYSSTIVRRTYNSRWDFIILYFFLQKNGIVRMR